MTSWLDNLEAFDWHFSRAHSLKGKKILFFNKLFQSLFKQYDRPSSRWWNWSEKLISKCKLIDWHRDVPNRLFIRMMINQYAKFSSSSLADRLLMQSCWIPAHYPGLPYLSHELPDRIWITRIVCRLLGRLRRESCFRGIRRIDCRSHRCLISKNNKFIIQPLPYRFIGDLYWMDHQGWSPQNSESVWIQFESVASSSMFVVHHTIFEWH